jgi:hypothetical protein
MIYTLKEAGRMVDLTADTLRKYIFDGRIEGIKKGRDWFLDTKTVNKLRNRRRYNYGKSE